MKKDIGKKYNMEHFLKNRLMKSLSSSCILAVINLKITKQLKWYRFCQNDYGYFDYFFYFINIASVLLILKVKKGILILHQEIVTTLKCFPFVWSFMQDLNYLVVKWKAKINLKHTLDSSDRIRCYCCFVPNAFLCTQNPHWVLNPTSCLSRFWASYI